MRYFLFSLFLILTGYSCLAQKNKTDSNPKEGIINVPPLKAPASQTTDTSVLNTVERQAVSGFNISQFIADKFSYPPAVLEDSNFVSVRILAEFIVERDASISNIKIKRVTNTAGTLLLPDTERLLKQEVIRVLHKMPDWQSPAYQGGKAVRSYYNLPIHLKSE